MNESKISVRYAKALFQAASEIGSEKVVMENLKIITEVFSMPQLKIFLESPIIKKSQKKKMFIALFEDRIDALSMNFLNLLLQHNREVYIIRIARNYKKLYYDKNAILEASISFPVAISIEQKAHLLKTLQDTYNSEIDLSEHVKPELIGGFVLRINDEQYDASVRSSLQRMKKALSIK